MNNQIVKYRPKVSIIVPFYNSSCYLKQCLNSIKNQTWADFEVICIDDGSNDNSGEICSDFVRTDSRFHMYRQPNSGVSAARNYGLKEAQGEYVCFVDSDDIVAPRYLERFLEVSNYNQGLAICKYTRDISNIDKGSLETSVVSIENFINDIFNESIVHPGIYTMLFNKSIIDNIDLQFTIGCVRNEDTEFYVKYLTYENNVITLDYNGYFYRDTPNSAVHRYDEKSLTFIEADQRITDYLRSKGIVDEDNLIVAATVELFIYKTARAGNLEIYNRVHELYDVRTMMKMMTKHARMSRKGVAFVYLLLGRSSFYKLLSLL